eukprot:GHVS01067841.1.p1 GENE.GHVS01067841.1~~GHVS01067841.1.p1  ORF type:complete len:289 (-),score=19.38 GHVS01067841.1:241-1107(-)
MRTKMSSPAWKVKALTDYCHLRLLPYRRGTPHVIFVAPTNGALYPNLQDPVGEKQKLKEDRMQQATSAFASCVYSQMQSINETLTDKDLKDNKLPSRGAGLAVGITFPNIKDQFSDVQVVYEEVPKLHRLMGYVVSAFPNTPSLQFAAYLAPWFATMRMAATIRKDNDPFHQADAKRNVGELFRPNSGLPTTLFPDLINAETVAKSNAGRFSPGDVLCGLMIAFNVRKEKLNKSSNNYFKKFVQAVYKLQQTPELSLKHTMDKFDCPNVKTLPAPMAPPCSSHLVLSD